MALDERLRQLADQVPPPPPGDPDAVFRRGLRRRRSRHVAGVAAAVGIVTVVGVGTASILDRPTQPDITEQPDQAEGDGTAHPEDWPTTIAPPSLTLSGSDPYTWAVAVAAGEDDRWCASADRGSSQVADAIGEPCDQLLTPGQLGDPDGFGTGGSEVEATPDGTPAQGLSWGFAPASADEVVVLFTDGSRARAGVASDGDVPAPLWAIGYEGVEVQAVEARRDGEVIAGRISATDIDAAGVVPATPQAVFGDRLVAQVVESFTDEQQQLLDLRASDELFQSPIAGTDRSVGIRSRDGSAPLMFATACDLLQQVELPDGWIGLCLEYTDPERSRVRGLFPYGTTSGG